MRIGILAVQGDFAEHEKMFTKLGVNSFFIRQPNDLVVKLDGIVLPGGESTAIVKLLNDTDLFSELKRLIKNQQTPTLATCAGLILLAQKIVNDTTVGLQTLPIQVKRNAFGRQIASFTAVEKFHHLGKIPMVFIRAPYITEINDPTVKVLAKVNKKIVGVQWNNQIGIAFHPELTDNTSVHKYFLKLVEQFANSKVN